MVTSYLLFLGQVAASYVRHTQCSWTSFKKFKCFFSVEEESLGQGLGGRDLG
jgi:hypothetical protein